MVREVGDRLSPQRFRAAATAAVVNHDKFRTRSKARRCRRISPSLAHWIRLNRPSRAPFAEIINSDGVR